MPFGNPEQRPTSPRELTENGRFAVGTVGGTFEGLHEGHRQYLRTAALLTEHLHVFVSHERRAQRQKPYTVTPATIRLAAIERFVGGLTAPSRLTMHVVTDGRDVKRFCCFEPVDLAVVIPEHRYRFEDYNEQRRRAGLAEFYILLKPRSRTDEDELSASSTLSR